MSKRRQTYLEDMEREACEPVKRKDPSWIKRRLSPEKGIEGINGGINGEINATPAPQDDSARSEIENVFKLEKARLNSDLQERKKEIALWQSDQRVRIEREATVKKEQLAKEHADQLASITEKYNKQLKLFVSNGTALMSGTTEKNVKYHHVYLDQFRVAHCRNACTSISMICVYLFTFERKNPLSFDWKMVFHHGSVAWVGWNEQRVVNSRNQLVKEVLDTECMGNVKERLNIDEELGGSLDVKWIAMHRETTPRDKTAFYSLDDFMMKFINESTSKRAAIFTIRSASTTIMYDPNKKDEIWLFDSHGKYVNGKSTLVQFDSIPTTCEHIARNYPLERVHHTDYLRAESVDDENRFSVYIFSKK